MGPLTTGVFLHLLHTESTLLQGWQAAPLNSFASIFSAQLGPSKLRPLGTA